MGDIYCKVCGEPWDSYGVHQSLRPDGDGDMEPAEAKMLLSGRGCPGCKGKQVVDCGMPEANEWAFPFSLYSKECEHYDWGRCKAEKCIKETDYRKPRKPISGMQFASSVVDNDDEDPIEAIAKMDKSVWEE